MVVQCGHLHAAGNAWRDGERPNLSAESRRTASANNRSNDVCGRRITAAVCLCVACCHASSSVAKVSASAPSLE